MAARREPTAAPHDAPAPVSAVPILHRPRNLAKRLDLSRQAVYDLIRRKELQAVRIGGGMRVPESSVLDYLRRCGLEVG